MSAVSRATAGGRAFLDLRQLAKSTGQNTQNLLTLYALEGFLVRLAASRRRDDLVLKGGVLLAAYDARRPTRDVDLYAKNVDNSTEQVLTLVRDIAAMPHEDGLTFDLSSKAAQTIRDGDEYSGVRVHMNATLATARLPLHVDVNVGDAVWPVPGLVEVTRLLGGTITVRGYPLTMVFAEKVVTAIERGTVSTRWRDFADIVLLSRNQDVNGDELRRSLLTVSGHRQAPLEPLAQVLDGYADIGQTRWATWVRRSQLAERVPTDFSAVLAEVMAFAEPALTGDVDRHVWWHTERRWVPGEGPVGLATTG